MTDERDACASNFACNMAAFQSSTIRAALLKTGIVDVLVGFLDKDSALHALVSIGTRRNARSYLKPHAHAIATTLLKEHDTMRCALLMHLLNISTPRAATDASVVQDATLYVRAALDKGQSSPSVAVHIIHRFAYPNLSPLVAASSLGVIYDAASIPIYEAVVRYGAGQVLVRRIGRAVVDDFVEQRLNGPFVGTIMRFMTTEMFADNLVDLVITETTTARFYAVAALAHFLQVDSLSKVGTRLCQHPRFAELQHTLIEAMERGADDSAHSVAPVVVLQLAVYGLLSAPSMLRFGSVLQTAPTLFRFAPTDDARAIRQIVGLGEALALENTGVLAQYKDALRAIEDEERKKRRLEEVGLGGMSLPDAFHCPVTMEVMRDPVVASDGHSYERQTLLTLLRTTARSPLTRARLDPRVVVSNINLRKRIRDYADEACDIANKALRVDGGGDEGVASS